MVSSVCCCSFLITVVHDGVSITESSVSRSDLIRRLAPWFSPLCSGLTTVLLLFTPFSLSFISASYLYCARAVYFHLKLSFNVQVDFQSAISAAHATVSMIRTQQKMCSHMNKCSSDCTCGLFSVYYHWHICSGPIIFSSPLLVTFRWESLQPSSGIKQKKKKKTATISLSSIFGNNGNKSTTDGRRIMHSKTSNLNSSSKNSFTIIIC